MCQPLNSVVVFSALFRMPFLVLMIMRLNLDYKFRVLIHWIWCSTVFRVLFLSALSLSSFSP